MRMRYTSALLALFVSITWYRRGDAFKKFILKHPAFPHGYLAGGEYGADCTTLRQVAEGPNADALRFCEDATFWEQNDRDGNVVERPLIVSCDAGRKKWNTVMGPLHHPEPRGTLWLYVPEKSGDKERGVHLLGSKITRNRAHPISLVNYPPNHDFHPLGIAIWPSHDGNSSNFYAVNHARKRTVIEQFAINPERPLEAVHVRTITSSYFLSPNALALTSPDSFYVTNDHLMTRRLPVLGHFLPILESILALPLGFVLHVALGPSASFSTNTGPIVDVVKPFISFPNGIALSPSGDEVAVAVTTMGEVKIYKRNPATNALTPKSSVSLPFLTDNLHYETGREGKPTLVVAGHPNLKDLEKVASNRTSSFSASWVVAVVPKSDGELPQTSFDLEAPVSSSTRVNGDGAGWTLRTLFQSSGDEHRGGFGSSSSGLVDPASGSFYVTGLYAHGGALVCKPGSAKSRRH